MRALILIVMILMAVPSMASSKKTVNVDSLSEKKRVEYLLKVSKKAILRYGPGYYRKIKPVKIKRFVANKTDSVTTYQMAKEHRGRAFYLVTYPYDPNQEHFHSGYSAKVWVWADNGVAFSIMFGNGWGYCNLDKPFRNEELKYVMPYKWSPPRKQNREDSQEGTGKTQESTEGEIYYIK